MSANKTTCSPSLALTLNLLSCVPPNLKQDYATEIYPAKGAWISVSTEFRVDRRSSKRGDCQFRHGAAPELSRPSPDSRRSNDDHLLGKECNRAGGCGRAIRGVSPRSGPCVNGERHQFD